MLAPVCPYCRNRSELTTGKELYPTQPTFWEKPFYVCRRDKAWVGCHKGTTTPLGRLADRDLRMAKQDAHREFDPLWRSYADAHNIPHHSARRKAYTWLAAQMGLSVKACHIGAFDLDQCKQLIKVIREVKDGLRQGI